MMIRSACRLVLLAAALLLPSLAPLPPAWAENPPSTLAAPEQAAIRQVIQSQLDAFQRDDAEAAYSYATPTIREKFGGAANFLQMVKTGYTPVYRPQSVAFEKLLDTEYGPDQVLRVIGPDGIVYTAHYMMQKQPDGSWMINGCFLTRAEDQNV